jgi:hypothetical protein
MIDFLNRLKGYLRDLRSEFNVPPFAFVESSADPFAFLARNRLRISISNAD